MTKICGIYAIKRIVANECYIGQSVNIISRWGHHKHILRKGKHNSRHFNRVFNKYGIEAFSFEILASGFDPLDRDLLTLAEQEFLDFYKINHVVYNTAPVAASMLGVRHSDETKAKISAMNKGKPAPNKDIPHSIETRAKMSVANKARSYKYMIGKKLSEETKEKIRISIEPSRELMRGVPLSAERKAKIGRGNKGKVRTPEMRAIQSAAMIGKPSPRKGVILSEETRAKISASRKAMFAARRAKIEEDAKV